MKTLLDKLGQYKQLVIYVILFGGWVVTTVEYVDLRNDFHDWTAKQERREEARDSVLVTNLRLMIAPVQNELENLEDQSNRWIERQNRFELELREAAIRSRGTESTFEEAKIAHLWSELDTLKVAQQRQAERIMEVQGFVFNLRDLFNAPSIDTTRVDYPRLIEDKGEAWWKVWKKVP